MSSRSIATEHLASSAQDGHSWGNALSDYWALTKPEVNFLILITTGVGFYLGCGSEARPLSVTALLNTLLGRCWSQAGPGH
jgi:heme O synthase-like polyprenyltransferase